MPERRGSGATPAGADGSDTAGVEQVLVVPSAALFGGRWPRGFVGLDVVGADVCAALEAQARLMDRPRAEADPSHKQPIPYCAVLRAGEVLTVERLSAQGETRLHGRLSIGIGGHVGPEDLAADGSTRGAIGRALRRELAEELDLPDGLPAPRLLGLIHDDSSAVGAVHVGLAYVLDLPDSVPRNAVTPREILKMRGGFRRLADFGGAWQDAASLESWSAVLLDVCLGQTRVSDHEAPLGSSRAPELRQVRGVSHRTLAKESGNGGTQDSEAVP